MADAYLDCPKSWYRGTLEPDSARDIVVSVRSGGTPTTSREDYWDGAIPWLTPKEVTRNGDRLFVAETERMITKAGLANCSSPLFPAGTVMLTKRAPVGAVAMNAIPMATNQGFLNFACGNRLRPTYFAYWLRANRPYLEQVANGSTYPELYPADLFEFEIAVPTVAEQDDIVRAIGALQHVALLGAALEQSVTDAQEMVTLQEQSRRLHSLRDELLPLLISGQIAPTEFDATAAASTRA